MMLKLRDYQEEAIASVKKHFSLGDNKQVIVLATGLGKTVIFGHLLAELVKTTGKKALVIAHREELLQQAKDKIEIVSPELSVGIEKAEQYADIFSDVIVASVQTIGRTNSDRIKRFNPQNFCIVVIDEAHHSSAETYKNVLNHFGLLKGAPESDWNAQCLLLGVTATPQRNDNAGIDQIFNSVTYDFGIIQGIERSWLSRIRAFRVRTATDLSGIKKVAGDFNLGELGGAVNNEDRNALIIKAYKTLTPDTQALCFAVDVAHAQELTKHFVDQGIPASVVLGSTPTIERTKRLSDFASGKIKVMVNAMVLTEGYDNASIQAILMARPTQSGILFQQMVGRGTRLYDGKKHLTVIDFVDNTFRQSLKTTASLLGIPGDLDFKGQDVLTVKGKVDKLLELAPNYNLEKLDIDKIKYAIEEVDLLAGLQVPEEISMVTTFEWHRYGEETYRIHMAEDRFISAKRTITGQWAVEGTVWDRVLGKYFTKEHDVQYATLDEAIRKVDNFIKKNYADQVGLVNTGAKWRKQSPSEKQISYLKHVFKVNQAVLDQIDKGQASRLITKLKMQRTGANL